MMRNHVSHELGVARGVAGVRNLDRLFGRQFAWCATGRAWLNYRLRGDERRVRHVIEADDNKWCTDTLDSPQREIFQHLKGDPDCEGQIGKGENP